MAAKKKSGRRPRATGTPKNYMICFYPKERAKLKKLAKHYDSPESEVIRMLIDHHFEKLEKPR